MNGVEFHKRVCCYKITSTLRLLICGDTQDEGLWRLQPRARLSKLDYFYTGITSMLLHRHVDTSSLLLSRPCPCQQEVYVGFQRCRHYMLCQHCCVGYMYCTSNKKKSFSIQISYKMLPWKPFQNIQRFRTMDRSKTTRKADFLNNPTIILYVLPISLLLKQLGNIYVHFREI